MKKEFSLDTVLRVMHADMVGKAAMDGSVTDLLEHLTGTRPRARVGSRKLHNEAKKQAAVLRRQLVQLAINTAPLSQLKKPAEVNAWVEEQVYRYDGSVEVDNGRRR